jgi:O-antigen/teichoic acid export membrane protein
MQQHYIKSSIAWSVASNALPLLLGLILIPTIIGKYGLERFGLLAISWSIVGYFGLFDMGLSRALTLMISKKNQIPESLDSIAELTFSALRMMWGLGLLGGIVLFFSASTLADILNVSSEIHTEAKQSFLILAVIIPFVVHTSGLEGVMDAYGFFKQSSFIRMIFGSGMFIAPYITSFYGANLINAVVGLAVLRILVWWIHYIYVKQTGILQQKRVFSSKHLRELMAFGGWLTVSNVVSPFMLYMDRFLIASVLGASAVAF